MRLLRGLVTTTIALALAAGAAPARADASSVRDCSGSGGHAADTALASNVLTRRVDCGTAHRFIRRYRGPAAGRAWRCDERETNSFSDIHCSRSGGRVIHWQAAWRRQQLG